MGKTHRKRSSRALFGSLVHIAVEFSIVLGKPPYVCAHYRHILTNILQYAILRTFDEVL